MTQQVETQFLSDWKDGFTRHFGGEARIILNSDSIIIESQGTRIIMEFGRDNNSFTLYDDNQKRLVAYSGFKPDQSSLIAQQIECEFKRLISQGESRVW